MPCDIDMADALEMREDRHPRLLLHARDEALAAARHDHVDIAVEARQHGADRRAVAGRHELDRVRRQARLLQPLAHGLRDGQRGTEAVRAAAQDHGIAGLQAERAGIRRHVGAALEDDADDAERRRTRSICRPFGRSPWRARGRPDRAVRRCSRPRRPWLRARSAFSVRRSMKAAALPACLAHPPGRRRWRRGSLRSAPGCDGHGAQRGVLLLGGRERHALRGGAGAAADIGHQRVDIAAFDHLQGIHPSPAPLKHRPRSGFHFGIRCVSRMAHREDPRARQRSPRFPHDR